MKNEFDDIIKRKWEKIHFPVDPHHRNDMNMLLDQTNRRRRGFAWWLGGVVLLIMISGSILYLSNGKNYFTENPNTDKSSNQIDKIEAAGNVLNIDHGNNITTNATGMSQLNASIDNNNATGMSQLNPITENINEYTSPTQNRVKESNSLNSPATSFSPSTNDVKNNILKAKTNINDKKPAEIKKQPGVPMASAEQESQSNQISSLIESGIEKNYNASSDISLTERDSENIIAADAKPEIVEDVIEHRPVYLLVSLADSQIGEIEFTRDNKIQTIMPASANKNSMHLFAETGLGYVPSSSAGIKAGWSFKAGGGIGYGLSHKTDLIFSGGYMFQKDGFAFERSSTSNTPGFGARSNFHYLAPDKLHFVYSKIGIQQRVRRHIFSASAGAQWLYGAQGKIVIQTTDQLTGVSEQPSYGWLVLKGMQRLIWTGELNYGYQVSSRLSMHLGLKYNFSSLRVEDEALTNEGYQWTGKFAPFQPAFTINYRFYGKK